jgi:hypothetical protein
MALCFIVWRQGVLCFYSVGGFILLVSLQQLLIIRGLMRWVDDG